MILSKAKVTTKGQITLPVRVMKKLNIKPGDKIIFEQNGNHLEIHSTREHFTIDDFIKKHKNQNKIKLTQDQLNQARQEAWEEKSPRSNP